MPAVVDVDADNVLLRLLLTPEGRAAGEAWAQRLSPSG